MQFPLPERSVTPVLPSASKKLDRAILDKRISLAFAKELPEYIARLDQIAKTGADREALAAITAMLDRLLGKPIERQEVLLHGNGATLNVVHMPSPVALPTITEDGTFLLNEVIEAADQHGKQ